MKNKEITVLDQEIHINKDDYFSLTDIAKYKILKIRDLSYRIGCAGSIQFNI